MDINDKIIQIFDRLGGVEKEQENIRKDLAYVELQLSQLNKEHIRCTVQSEHDRGDTEKIDLNVIRIKSKLSEHDKTIGKLMDVIGKHVEDDSSVKKIDDKLNLKDIDTWIRISPYIILGLSAVAAVLGEKVDVLIDVLGKL